MYLLASNAYTDDSLTWCVQAKRPYSKWENFFQICTDWRVYIAMSISELVSQIFVYVLLAFEYSVFPKWDFHEITLIGFAYTFGLSYPIYPKHSFFRMIVGSYLIMAFLLNIIILTKYQETMTVPIYNLQINTVNEIIENDFKLAGDPFALEFLSERNEV